jgi:pimeloyl-ACP methyl ester carboxylesterase
VAKAAAAADAAAMTTHTLFPSVTTTDGAQLHVEDWGQGAPIVFTHGWTVGHEMWERQMTALADAGLRAVGIDRRGCGRSTSGRDGFALDRLADDLAQLLAALDLQATTLVAHSMGAAEAVRMLARHGSDRIARLVLVAPTTPRPAAAPDHPHGIPAAVFDDMIAGLAADKPAYLAAAAPGFFGTGQAVSAEMTAWGVALAARAPLRTAIGLVRAFSQADQRDELAAVDVPTLVIHGDADASAPLELCGRPTATGIADARLVIYPGGPHGLPLSNGHSARLTDDLFAFTSDGGR